MFKIVQLNFNVFETPICINFVVMTQKISPGLHTILRLTRFYTIFLSMTLIDPKVIEKKLITKKVCILILNITKKKLSL